MGNSSLNVSPEKGEEREMRYWNCEGPSLHRPTSVRRLKTFTVNLAIVMKANTVMKGVSASGIIQIVMHLTLQFAAQSAPNALWKDTLP